MATLILTFAVFLLAVLAMVVGVLLSGRSLKGSCGGPSCACAREGRDVTACPEDRGPSLPVVRH
jgi:hypothetical protein